MVINNVFLKCSVYGVRGSVLLLVIKGKIFCWIEICIVDFVREKKRKRKKKRK